MKKLKSLAVISLASLFVFSHVQAAEPKKNAQKQTSQKQQTKQTSKKQTTQKSSKKTSTVKKAAAGTAAAAATTAAASKVNQEDPLKQFNEAFGITFMGYRVESDASGQSFLFLKYDLINKGNKPIKAVKFIGAFTHNNNIIYAQEIPLTFNQPLNAKDKNSIEMKIPFANVPEASRNIFLTANAPISAVNGAQALVFSDNTGIVIK